MAEIFYEPSGANCSGMLSLMIAQLIKPELI